MERKYKLFHEDQNVIVKCISEDYTYDSIKLLLDSYTGDIKLWNPSPLCFLLMEERYDIFELFLKYGFDIDYLFEDNEYPGIKLTLFYPLIVKMKNKQLSENNQSVTIDFEKAKFLITHRLNVNEIMFIEKNIYRMSPLEFIMNESFVRDNKIHQEYYNLLKFLFHFYSTINIQPIIALIFKGKDRKCFPKNLFSELIKKHIKYLDFDNINEILCFDIVTCRALKIVQLVISYLGIDTFVKSEFYKSLINIAGLRNVTDFLSSLDDIIRNRKLKILERDNMKIFDLIKMNRIREVENLLKLHPNIINIRNVEKKTPLMFAIQYCNNNTEKMVNLLIKYKANKNVVDNNGFTPLHMACQLNSYKNIKELITETNINKGDHFFNIPLMISIMNNYNESTMALLSSQFIDVTIHDHEINTPLTFMIRNNRENKDIYKLLIKKGAYIKYDHFKYELLSNIVENKVFLECIIDYGFHLLMKNDTSIYISTPLIFSMKEDLPLLTESIINCYNDGYKGFINEKDKDGNSFIFYAIESENEAHLKLLINIKNININVRKKDTKETPLMVLIKHKKYQFVKLLLQHFKDIDVNISDQDQQSPLLYMIHNNYEDKNSFHLEIFKLLISHGANINERYQGNSLLILSLKMHHYEYAKLILENLKSVIDQTDKNGKSVLSVMIKNEIDHEELFNLLFEKGGFIESKDITNSKFLLKAEKNCGFIKSIIPNGLIISKTKGKIEAPIKTPVIFFIEKQQLGMVEKLLENGSNCEEIDEELFLTPIFHSVLCNNKDLFLLLLNKYHAKTAIKDRINSGKTINLLSFIKQKNDINPQLNPVFLSTLQSKNNLKKSGHSHMNNNSTNNNTNTNTNTNTNKNSSLNTHSKTNEMSSEVKDILLDKRIVDYSELHLACLNENEEMINLLLEFSYNINEPCYDGSSPLLLSIKNQKIKSIECLLKNNADIFLPDNQGETAITYILKNLSSDLYMKIFHLLIPYIDINKYYPPDNLTLIHYLIKCNNITGINNIISGKSRISKIDINAVDGQGDTPLLYALKYSKKCSIELLEILLSNGADVNCIDYKNSYTPLFYAVERMTMLQNLLIYFSNIT